MKIIRNLIIFYLRSWTRCRSVAAFVNDVICVTNILIIFYWCSWARRSSSVAALVNVIICCIVLIMRNARCPIYKKCGHWFCWFWPEILSRHELCMFLKCPTMPDSVLIVPFQKAQFICGFFVFRVVLNKLVFMLNFCIKIRFGRGGFQIFLWKWLWERKQSYKQHIYFLFAFVSSLSLGC